MASTLTQARAAEKLLKDAQAPDLDLLLRWFDSIKQLDLLNLPFYVTEHFHEELSQIDLILNEYRDEPEEERRLVTDSDMRKMFELAESATQRIINGEEDRLTMELDEAFDTLPVEAIQEIRVHRDMMVPVLIELLQDTVQSIRDGEECEGMLPFFTLFLLSELNAKEGLPAIIEAISLPTEQVNVMFSDAITESLAQILAQLAEDQIDQLDTLILNPEVDEYVRWAAVSAHLFWVRDGLLQREEAIQRLKKYLRTAIDQKDEKLAFSVVFELHQLSAVDAIDDINEAFELKLVDESEKRAWEIGNNMEGSEELMREAFERLPETGIQDTVEELRHWHCFSEKENKSDTLIPSMNFSKYDPSFATPGVNDIIPTSNKIGRNEPCPCGSGKKYKKCCGKKG